MTTKLKSQKSEVSFAALLLWLTVSAVHAQTDYTMDWLIIGGGGTGAGDAYSISYVVGEPRAGVMSGGDFTLEIGFWDLIAPPQVPRLRSISQSPDGQFIIEWQVQSGRAYRLQFKESLSEANWTTLGEDHTAVSMSLAIIHNAGLTRHGFYRLVDVTNP